jgi:hypothetical protein
VIVNLPQIVRAHDLFLARNSDMVRDASERAAKHVVEHVARYPEFKPRSGKLQKATKARVIRGRIVRITNNKPYAQAIDGGARPHVIRPKRAKLLRFVGRGGKIVFARKVNHPGNRPYKFAYKATNSAYRLLGQHLEHEMQNHAKRF